MRGSKYGKTGDDGAQTDANDGRKSTGTHHPRGVPGLAKEWALTRSVLVGGKREIVGFSLVNTERKLGMRQQQRNCGQP